MIAYDEVTYRDIYVLDQDAARSTVTWLTAGHKVLRWSEEQFEREISQAYVNVLNADDYLTRGMS